MPKESSDKEGRNYEKVILLSFWVIIRQVCASWLSCYPDSCSRGIPIQYSSLLVSNNTTRFKLSEINDDFSVHFASISVHYNRNLDHSSKHWWGPPSIRILRGVSHDWRSTRLVSTSCLHVTSVGNRNKHKNVTRPVIFSAKLDSQTVFFCLKQIYLLSTWKVNITAQILRLLWSDRLDMKDFGFMRTQKLAEEWLIGRTGIVIGGYMVICIRVLRCSWYPIIFGGPKRKDMITVLWVDRLSVGCWRRSFWWWS